MKRDNYEIIKDCIEMEPNTYKYASSKLRDNFELAKFFLERGGSFISLNKKLLEKLH